MPAPLTRLQTLRLINEMLCALYGMMDVLGRFRKLNGATLTLDDIASMSGQIGLLIMEIEQGRILDFP